MLDQSTTSAERDFMSAWAADERRSRMLAEAVNESMTLGEAEMLLACVTDNAPEWPTLVEDAFNAAVWPDDDLSEVWLDKIGQTVWAVYRAYRALGTKVAA